MQKGSLAVILATSSEDTANYLKPLGLGYIKSYLNQYVPTISVAIYNDFDELIKSRPDCVGISSSTENYSLALQYVEKVKTILSVPVIIGGVHISLLPESLPPGTIGCIGEGEETVRELMEIFIQDGQFSDERLSAVPGIAFWDSLNNLRITPARPLIHPLDVLPFPDRSFLGMKKKSTNSYIFTSRGCPYSCKFCVSRVHWNKYREFSASYVIREIEHLIRTFNVKKITIFDDLFIVNRKRLKEIVEEFELRKFSVDVCCAVRANLVDDELCSLLKRMNVSEVTFGAESFSESVLRELKCNSVTVEQNKNAIELFYRYGIRVNCSFIFCSPEQKRDDIVLTWQEIFRYLKDKKINHVGIGILRPYPGSYYWDLAQNRGLAGLNMDWELFKHPERLYLNDNIPLEEWHFLLNEWDIKCALVNLSYMDGGRTYSSHSEIFFKNEFIINSIISRQNKDISDYFVQEQYESFLKTLLNHGLSLNEGWGNPDKNGFCWIQRTASFLLDRSVLREGEYITLLFFIPDISYYPDKKITVEFIINNISQRSSVNTSGFHRVTVKIPFFSRLFGRTRLRGEIRCDSAFSPSEVSEMKEIREISIVFIKFEISENNADNIVNFVRISPHIPKSNENAIL